MRVLIIEDEPKAAAYLRKGLTENGYVVDVADTGEDGLHLARTGAYDLIILDVMLPGMGGYELLRHLHAEGNETPVLILSARGDVEDRVRGLELGGR